MIEGWCSVHIYSIILCIRIPSHVINSFHLKPFMLDLLALLIFRYEIYAFAMNLGFNISCRQMLFECIYMENNYMGWITKLVGLNSQATTNSSLNIFIARLNESIILCNFLSLCNYYHWRNLVILNFRGSFVQELKLLLIRGKNFCRSSSKCSNKGLVPFLTCLLLLEEIISSFQPSSKIHFCSR